MRKSLAVYAALCSSVALAQQPPTQAFVVNTGDGTVSQVDLQSGKEIRKIQVGPRPYGIALSRDGQALAVGVEDEEKVKFLRTSDFTAIGEVRIGKMFNDHIALTPDGKHVLVANFYSDDVVAIEVESRKEAFRIKGTSAPHVVKYGPSRKNAYVTCKKITGIAIIDPANRKLVKFHQINVNPRSLTFSPNESKVYFGSFWVNGFFEMETNSGKVTRLFELSTPPDNSAAQEVTYHGVEMVYPNIVLAANEGRSYLDAVDITTGELLDRLSNVSKPCCIETIPGPDGASKRVLISNIGDGTIQAVEVTRNGKLKPAAKIVVGKAPKRVAFAVTDASGRVTGDGTVD
jgi:YVTN family beta-propeller protein